MTPAYDEIFTRPTGDRAEFVRQAIAASPLFRAEAGETEQEAAARIVASRDRMRQHDAYFADEFISPAEQHIISRTLARKLGYQVGDDRETGDMDRDEKYPYGDD